MLSYHMRAQRHHPHQQLQQIKKVLDFVYRILFAVPIDHVLDIRVSIIEANLAIIFQIFVRSYFTYHVTYLGLGLIYLMMRSFD